MKTTLVIMAAGLGSRYGGIKQLAPVGPSGEIIMDYSIHDAIEAGFDQVAFIIRRDLEKDFKEVVGDRISKKVKTIYIFQDMEHIPEGCSVPEGRVKPWGTGHAVMCCHGVVDGPFVVINADDYYGKEGFRLLHDYLTTEHEKDGRYHFAMAGFSLGNTLSENGTVARGVCTVDEQGKLVDIVETGEIAGKGTKASGVQNGKETELALDCPVSMNMWGFTEELLAELSQRFTDFYQESRGNEQKAEYMLPKVVDDLIKEGKADVTVLKTSEKWFGVTYQEDREAVVNAFKELMEKGVYPESII